MNTTSWNRPVDGLKRVSAEGIQHFTAPSHTDIALDGADVGVKIDGMTRTGDLYSSDEYLKRNPSYHMEDAEWKAGHILSLLKRNGLNPTSFTEIGCGAGQILTHLKLALPTARFSGYDISEAAIGVARAKSDQTIEFTVGDFTTLETKPVDMLLCIDVFEHVPDYPGFLKALRPKASYKIFHIPLELSVYKVLMPGRLLVSTHRFGHIHFFNRETALHALTDAGYEILDSFFTCPGADRAATLEARIGSLPVKFISLFSNGLAARLAGAHSLMVLAR